MSGTPLAPGHTPDAVTGPREGEVEAPWQRTDARMVLITVVSRLASLALPVVVVVLRLESEQEGWWSLGAAGAGALLAMVSAVASWHATRYRLDAERLQVRRGVLNRKVLTARLDRVRSVDLEAPLLHRVLGLAKVTVGTGHDGERITLDSLSRERSAELREQLLRRGRAAGAETAAADDASAAGPPDAEPGAAPADDAPARDPASLASGAVLARMDLAWVRYAPARTLGGAAVLGVSAGSLFGLLRETAVGRAVAAALPDSTPVLVALGVTVAVVGGMVVATVRWASRWWGMVLTREPGGTLHLHRGLTTTASTTVEEARIRGLRLDEPFLTRPFRGAELDALTTGVGFGGAVTLLPVCPREVAVDVGRAVLGAPGEDPLTMPTRRHGPAARRRLLVGAVVDAVVVAAVAAGVLTWQGWDPWLVGALGVGVALVLVAGLRLAAAEHRHRGHALTRDHLVVTSGRLRRRRMVLQTRGIIGWTVEESVLQRRLGLCTLTATTAAGPEAVSVTDVPLGDAIELALRATPDVWASVR